MKKVILMKHDIDITDYFLIGSGILLMPVFGLGLIPIGAGIFRIGSKMQKHKEQVNKDLEEFDKQTKWEINEIERESRKNEYDHRVLEKFK